MASGDGHQVCLQRLVDYVLGIQLVPFAGIGKQYSRVQRAFPNCHGVRREANQIVIAGVGRAVSLGMGGFTRQKRGPSGEFSADNLRLLFQMRKGGNAGSFITGSPRKKLWPGRAVAKTPTPGDPAPARPLTLTSSIQ